MDGVVRRTAATAVVSTALLVAASGGQDRRGEGPYAKVAGDALPRIEDVSGLLGLVVEGGERERLFALVLL